MISLSVPDKGKLSLASAYGGAPSYSTVNHLCGNRLCLKLSHTSHQPQHQAQGEDACMTLQSERLLKLGALVASLASL